MRMIQTIVMQPNANCLFVVPFHEIIKNFGKQNWVSHSAFVHALIFLFFQKKTKEMLFV